MGLFKKKKEEIKKVSSPKLPELPKLPEIPQIEEPGQEIHKLPKFPKNSFGEKFSQDTIKEAVTGEKEGEEVSADESAKKKKQVMQKPLIKKSIVKPPKAPQKFKSPEREIKAYKYPSKVKEAYESSYPFKMKAEKKPLFVRIDKVEEGIKSLREVSSLISEIREMLQNLKKVKEEEAKELLFWEEQIQNAKKEVEKIEKDFFSRVGE